MCCAGGPARPKGEKRMKDQKMEMATTTDNRTWFRDAKKFVEEKFPAATINVGAKTSV